MLTNVPGWVLSALADADDQTKVLGEPNIPKMAWLPSLDFIKHARQHCLFMMVRIDQNRNSRNPRIRLIASSLHQAANQKSLRCNPTHKSGTTSRKLAKSREESRRCR